MKTSELTRDPSHNPTGVVPLGDNTHFHGKISLKKKVFYKNVLPFLSQTFSVLPACESWSLLLRDTVGGLFSAVKAITTSGVRSVAFVNGTWEHPPPFPEAVSENSFFLVLLTPPVLAQS